MVPNLDNILVLIVSPTLSASLAMKNDPQYPGPSASLVESEYLQKTWKETLMSLNQQMKEVSKWNTPLISCAAQL